MNDLTKNNSLVGLYPILTVLLILCGIFSLMFGSADITLSEFIAVITGNSDKTVAETIILQLRLPRVLGAILAGMGLSVSGVLLQSVTDNALAGPNIIGVNSGAGLAVIVIMYFMPETVYIVPFASFIGAFFTTVLIVSIAMGIGKSRSTVILAGIAVTAMFSSGISFISLLDPDVLASYNYFSVGSLSGIMLGELAIPAVMILVSAALAMMLSNRIDILCLGDQVAGSLGVRAHLLRMVSLILASACAASVVSFAGLLGFVGLVVPHIARKLVGSSVVQLIPVSALCGGILVCVADLVGRTVISPSEIPVGIIMSLIGAPFFLWLLFKR